MKKIRIAFIITAIVVACGVLVYQLQNQLSNTSEKTRLLEVNFNISSKRDTVVESPSGMVLQIPARAFVNPNGEDVESFTLAVEEARTSFDIMKSGLNTMSGDRLLETAGMFKLTATSNGDTLDLREGSEIWVDVPTKEVKPDMMLFEGVEKDGVIDWVNPKPISNDLVTVPFSDLNFYPPGFLDSLAAWGYDASDRSFTDSVYYSFPCNLEVEPPYVPVDLDLPNLEESYETSTSNFEWVQVSDEPVQQELVYNETAELVLDSAASGEESTTASRPREICPASIHALTTNTFANTYIATHEFEERLAVIFGLCNEAILDVYVDNIGNDLWIADSIAAAQLSGYNREVFENFASKRMGNTDLTNTALDQLSSYYIKKKKAYDKAVAKTRSKLYETYTREDAENLERLSKSTTKRWSDVVSNSSDELTANLKEAYRQANLPYPTPPIPEVERYRFPVTNLTWNNLDRYVIEQTTKRKSIKTRYNGYDVSIEYKPIKVDVDQAENFDFLKCYLVPHELTSYQLMKERGGSYEAKLNELFQYDLYCIGSKGDQWYLFEKGNIGEGIIKAELKPVSDNEIERRLSGIKQEKASWSVEEDVMMNRERLKYEQRLIERKSDEEFREKLEGIIWPCCATSDEEMVMCNDRLTIRNGEALFKQKCQSCHSVHRRTVGPKLKGLVKKYDLNYLVRFTQDNVSLREEGNPRAIEVYNEYSGTTMLTFKSLSAKEILSIFSYAESGAGKTVAIE
ncbi:MAG: cytochrome c [Bacteroidia bacterium]|nr:cytochrome c [Bacteroidia bacterium]